MYASLRKTVFFLAALLVICSCGKNAIIPKRTLSKIYADMLLTESWLRTDLYMKHMADTSMVYESIFNKYGYTTEDYWRTVDRYMNDPDKFSKIFEKAASRLDEDAKYVEAEKAWTDAMDSYRKLLERRDQRMFFAYDSIFTDRLAPWKNPEISLDTTVNVYLPDYYERRDSARTARRDSVRNERRDSVRTDIQPKTRKLIRDKSATGVGEALQF